jgi:nicotinamidase/pyrazinamidase
MFPPPLTEHVQFLEKEPRPADRVGRQCERPTPDPLCAGAKIRGPFATDAPHLIVRLGDHDFPCPSPHGDAILPVVNAPIPCFPLVVATQDWHPAAHASFASSHKSRRPFERIDLAGRLQTLWPDHCQPGSQGADFPSQWETRPVAAIVRKGMDPKVDSYSGFFDNHRLRQTGLSGYLKGLGVTEIFLAGLAAEVCVAFTAADGVQEGFVTTVVEDGTRPLDDALFRDKKAELEDTEIRFTPSAPLRAALRPAA